MKRNPYLHAWIVFTLLGTIGGNLAAYIVVIVILPFFDMAGASQRLIWWVRVLTHFVVALWISYIVFRDIMRKRFVAKASGDESPAI